MAGARAFGAAVRRAATLVAAAAIALTAVLAAVPGTASAAAPVRSKTAWTYEMGATQRANIAARADGGFDRVEWIDGTGLVVETYSKSFSLTGQKTFSAASLAPAGLQSGNKVLWGGFLAGANNHYVVTGQNNLKESKDVNTLRVTKFSKDWKVVSSRSYSQASTAASLATVGSGSQKQGIEVFQPFAAGTLRMAELGGNLWIATAATGYNGGDGYHHQGSLKLVVRESDLVATGNAADFYHSFDQYVAPLGGRMYGAETSDGLRSVFAERLSTSKFTGGWSANWAAGSDALAQVFKFWTTDNGIWSYATYGSSGGFATSSTANRLIVAGAAADQSLAATKGAALPLNLWVASVDASSMKQVSNVQLTNYASDSLESATRPLLVKASEDSFVLMWGVTKKSYPQLAFSEPPASEMRFCFLNGSGKKVSQVYAVPGDLSSCQPVVSGGKVTWYASGTPTGMVTVVGKDYTGAPTFYQLDLKTKVVRSSDPKRGFQDLTASDWAVREGWVDYAAGAGLMSGLNPAEHGGKRLFAPYDRVTRGQMAVILWRMAGSPAAPTGSKDFADNRDAGAFYYQAVRWASSVGVVTGIRDPGKNTYTSFGPGWDIQRQDLAVMMQRYAEKVAKKKTDTSTAKASRIGGWSQVASYARPAVGWAANTGLMGGVKLAGGRTDLQPTAPTDRSAAAKMASVLKRDVIG